MARWCVRFLQAVQVPADRRQRTARQRCLVGAGFIPRYG